MGFVLWAQDWAAEKVEEILEHHLMDRERTVVQ